MKRKKKNNSTVYAILHNIRSLHNVGSMLRTADAAGVKKVFLTGYTPAPIDAFGKVRTDIAKTALGAERTVSWEKAKDISKLIRKLKGEGMHIVALEQDKHAIDYKTFKPKHPLALLVGNEVRGLSRAVLNQCDAIIEVPMRGKKESLNVSVAFGIGIFEIAAHM